jgi:uncharacterized protein (TIGR00369 family)
MALQIPPNCDLTLGLTCLEKGADATTVWRMRVDERFLNPAGIVQGGFLSAMMDSAMGASAVLSVKDRKVFVANTEMKSSFLRPVRNGDVLTCTATVLKPGTWWPSSRRRILDEEGNSCRPRAPPTSSKNVVSRL